MRRVLVSFALLATSWTSAACLGNEDTPCGPNASANATVTPAEPCLVITVTSCQGVANSTEIDNQCSDPLVLDLAPDLDGADDSGHETVAPGAQVHLFGRDVPDGGLVLPGASTGTAMVAGMLGTAPVTLAFAVPST